MITRHLETRVELAAPLARVSAILDDFERYATWTDAIAFRGRPSVGATTPMLVRLFGRVLPVPVRFDVLDPTREIRWTGGPAGLMTGTHYLRLRALDDARTELVHGEDFHGLALPLLWPVLREELRALYDRVNSQLAAQAALAVDP